MPLKCGIVGLPNVGKSTIFRSLTNSKAEVANYPFCTIDPNQGSVVVPDERLDALNDIFKAKSVVPTTVEIVDIAGLVKGASVGEGLGNQFLANIREVDAICHVVRCFEDDNVVHVEGRVDPISDCQTIETELQLKDLDTVTKRFDKAEKLARHEKKGEQAFDTLKRIKEALEDGKTARSLKLTEEEQEHVEELCLLTLKPVIYVANVSENDLPDGGKHTEALKKYADDEGAECLIISGKFEYELADLEEEERGEYLESVGLTEPGKYPLIRTVYKTLGLITFLTAGEKEVRAWTVRENSVAPKAAGVIHTDFERGFIACEVIPWKDLVENEGYGGAKDKGVMKLEGKSYIVQDGDVCTFRFNV